jgi:phosphomevalonate kinase
LAFAKILETITPSSEWTTGTTPIALPPHIRLVLADVDAGSDTPSLVGKVLKWRKENPDTGRLPQTHIVAPF